jgi:hypothetical protein
MEEDPVRAYRRWQALEGEGRDEEADRAFETVFKTTLASLPVPPEFTAKTMTAVAAAAQRDLRRVRRVRRASLGAGVAGGAAAMYFGAGYILAGVSAVAVRLIDLLVVGVIYVVTVVQSGADVWSIAATLGRAMGALVMDPKVAVALVMMQGIAVAAFIALRRLLESDVEILK